MLAKCYVVPGNSDSFVPSLHTVSLKLCHCIWLLRPTGQISLAQPKAFQMLPTTTRMQLITFCFNCERSSSKSTTRPYLANQLELIKAVLWMRCAIIPHQFILFCQLHTINKISETQGWTRSELKQRRICDIVCRSSYSKLLTGCVGGRPNAIGPPPPLLVGAIACAAMILRDKPASDAGRSAIAAN